METMGQKASTSPASSVYTTIVGWVVFVEFSLHVISASFTAAVPIANKWIRGTTITVPIYSNGALSGYQAADKIGAHDFRYLIKRGATLLWQGFLLQPLNEPFAKMRAYRATFLKYEGNPYVPYVRKADLPYSYAGISVTTDQNGFLVYPAPADKKPVMTILTLGDSTTDSDYPVFMWKILNSRPGPGFRVVNGALPSYTSADNLVSFALHGVDYKPRVVVLYEANNDMFPLYLNDSSTVFRTDYTHWRDFYRFERIERMRWMDKMPRVLDYCAIYAVLRTLLIRDTAALFSWGLWGVTTHYVAELKDPNRFQGLDVYRRNLRSLAGIARFNGATLLLVTQMHQPKFASPAEFEYAERMNASMRDVARSLGDDVRFLDFAQDFVSRRDELMVRDSVHFDSPGYQVLGEAIGREILLRLREDPSRR